MLFRVVVRVFLGGVDEMSAIYSHNQRIYSMKFLWPMKKNKILVDAKGGQKHYMTKGRKMAHGPVYNAKLHILVVLDIINTSIRLI